jgi:hypothetical protein
MAKQLLSSSAELQAMVRSLCIEEGQEDDASFSTIEVRAIAYGKPVRYQESPAQQQVAPSLLPRHRSRKPRCKSRVLFRPRKIILHRIKSAVLVESLAVFYGSRPVQAPRIAHASHVAQQLLVQLL